MGSETYDEYKTFGLKVPKGKKITIIENKVYDISEFIYQHPGGGVILTQIGVDATDAFNSFHPKSTQEILSDYLDLELTQQLKLVKDDNQFLKEIRDLKLDFEREGIFQSNLSFYFLMGIFNLSIFALSLYLVYYYGDSYLALTLSACLLGLFWQQCGWHAHEYLHHQVFQNRNYNNWVGGYFFGAVCQGFSPSWWKDKHNTHHAVPNIYDKDPDIDTHPFLAWSENAMELYAELNDQDLASHLKMFMLHNQPTLFFPLLAFARLSWCFFSFYFAISNGQMGDKRRLQIPIHFMEPLCLSLHWFLYLTITFTLPTTLWKSLFYLLISQTSSGVLLASVFSLNHNGMRVLSREEADKMDFFTIQAETGRDVHPSYFMTWFCGGLNYQIEHHLFPTIPRHNFHKIQKRISEVCKRHHINYHLTGFLEGTVEVLSRLDRVSKTISKQIDIQHTD